MTDLHTHILPGMDDGARDEEMSLQMLRMEWQQGVDTVVLTPHFYREQETAEQFLSRRAQAYDRLRARLDRLPAEEREALPRLILGAEVTFVPNLDREPGLEKLCIGQTPYMLLEMPFYPWSSRMLQKINALIGRSGVTPVLAHIERYLPDQKKALTEELLDMGLPVQMGTELLLGGTMARRQGMKLLKQRKAHFVASDCHDPVRRPPNVGKAMAIVESKLGRGFFEELAAEADELVMDMG